MKEPVSKETVDLVLRAQRAITKIESGPAVADFLTAEENAALTWAVLEVTKLYLFSSEPLTQTEFAIGQEIARRITERNKPVEPYIGYSCTHCGGGHLGIHCGEPRDRRGW